jgi:hypothetical protein
MVQVLFKYYEKDYAFFLAAFLGAAFFAAFLGAAATTAAGFFIAFTRLANFDFKLDALFL